MLINTIRITNILMVVLSSGFIIYQTVKIGVVGTMPYLSFSPSFFNHSDEVMSFLLMAQILLILSITAVVMTELINVLLKSNKND